MAYRWGGMVDIINKLFPSVEIFLLPYTHLCSVYGEQKLYFVEF